MSFFDKVKTSFGNAVDKLKGNPTNSSERFQHWRSTGIVGVRDSNIKELPDILEKLSESIKVIDATNNKLQQLPTYLPKFVNLQRLVISVNSFRVLPLSIGALPSLKILIVDSNQLSELPESIGGLSKLEKFSASNNKLTTLPKSVGQLKQLQSLNIASNFLTTLPDELGDCSALEEIDFQNNELTLLPPALGKLKKLKTLQLDQNGITAIPSEIFIDCVSLQTLSVHSNPITVDVVQSTEGYAAFEERRRSKYDKSIAAGVLLGSNGMDEGVDRLTTKT